MRLFSKRHAFLKPLSHGAAYAAISYPHGSHDMEPCGRCGSPPVCSQRPFHVRSVMPYALHQFGIHTVVAEYFRVARQYHLPACTGECNV